MCLLFFFRFFKGGGLKLCANQTGNGEAGFYLFVSSNELLLVEYKEEFKGKKFLKGTD